MIQLAFGLASLLCLIVSSLIAAEWWRLAQLAKHANQWIRVSGRILTSRAVRIVAFIDPETGPHHAWEWRVEYEYEFHGLRRGSSYDLGGNLRARSEFELRKWLDRYPEGSQTIVWLDPKAPENSVLERSLPYRLLLIAVLVGGASMILGYFAIH
jgi:hypothetical protein